jgi:hypothetical protein
MDCVPAINKPLAIKTNNEFRMAKQYQNSARLYFTAA